MPTEMPFEQVRRSAIRAAHDAVDRMIERREAGQDAEPTDESDLYATRAEWREAPQ